MEEDHLLELFISFLQEIYFDSYPDLIQVEDPEKYRFEYDQFLNTYL